MSPIDDLIPILKKLRLSGLLDTLELRTRQAVEDNLSHGEFLFRLLSDEAERRDSRKLQLRIQRAHFDSPQTLEDFNFAFNPDIPKARIIDLATCLFVQRHDNVALVGPAGVGKSHVAQAIGQRACRAGYKVLYTTAHALLSQLRASRADNTYDRSMRRFTAPDLLIVDDLGLRPLQYHEPLDLYELIRGRYERGSVVITSNRDIKEWYPLFGDELLASAAMDRFLHHAEVIRMRGHSHRNPPESSQTNATAPAAHA